MNLALLHRARSHMGTRVTSEPRFGGQVRKLIADLTANPNPEAAAPSAPTPAPASAPEPEHTPDLEPDPEPEPEPAPTAAVALTPEPAPAAPSVAAAEVVATLSTAASTPTPRAHGSKVFNPIAGDPEALTIPYNPHDPAVTKDRVIAVVARVCDVSEAALRSAKRGSTQESHARFLVMVILYWMLDMKDAQIAVELGGRKEGGVTQSRRVFESTLKKDDLEARKRMRAVLAELGATQPAAPALESEPAASDAGAALDQITPTPRAMQVSVAGSDTTHTIDTDPRVTTDMVAAEEVVAPIAVEPPVTTESVRHIESGRLGQILELPPRLAEGFRDPLIAAIEETAANAAKLLRGESLPDDVTAEMIYRDLQTIAGTVPLVVDGIARGKKEKT